MKEFFLFLLAYSEEFFLFLLAVYVVQSLIHHRRSEEADGTKVRRAFALPLQLAVFGLASYFAYRGGAFSRELVSPVYIGLGFVAGHLIFGVSLLVTHRSVEDASGHFKDFGGVWRFVADHPYVLSRFVYVAISEEVIWRVTAQSIAIEHVGETLAVVAAALAFSLVHEHFFKNSFLVSLEFLGFALLLGVLYLLTGSLILVIIIHALRDIEIAYIEYVIRVHELGDEAQAAKEIEETYMRPLRRAHE